MIIIFMIDMFRELWVVIIKNNKEIMFYWFLGYLIV